MSPLTFFIAKLLGAVMIVMAAMLLSRGASIAPLARRMLADPGLVMISGALRLVAGLAIVIGHDVWSGGALPIAVSLFGWLLLLSGLLLLFASEERLLRVFDAMKFERHIPAYSIGMALAGLYFLGEGFLG